MSGHATLARWVFRMFITGAMVFGIAQVAATAVGAESPASAALACDPEECQEYCELTHGPGAIGTCQRGDFPPYCLCEY